MDDHLLTAVTVSNPKLESQKENLIRDKNGMVAILPDKLKSTWSLQREKKKQNLLKSFS